MGSWACKSLKDLAPQVGFEPTTLRLTAECSTVELLRSNTGGLVPLQQSRPLVSILHHPNLKQAAREAAVDRDRLTRDVARTVRAKIHDRIREFIRLPQTPQRDLRRPSFLYLRFRHARRFCQRRRKLRQTVRR